MMTTIIACCSAVNKSAAAAAPALCFCLVLLCAALTTSALPSTSQPSSHHQIINNNSNSSNDTLSLRNLTQSQPLSSPPPPVITAANSKSHDKPTTSLDDDSDDWLPYFFNELADGRNSGISSGDSSSPIEAGDNHRKKANYNNGSSSEGVNSDYSGEITEETGFAKSPMFWLNPIQQQILVHRSLYLFEENNNRSWIGRGQAASRALEAIQAALMMPQRTENSFIFESPKGHWIVADVVVSLLAIFANLVFIDAIRNIQLDLKGYKHFLINLSATDILTAIICLANFSHQAFSNYTQSLLIQKCGVNILRSLNIAGLLSNLLSLFGMSIDHYIGVFHPLRYQKIMGNAKVVNSAILLIWVISLLSAVFDSVILFAFYFFDINSDMAMARRSLMGQQGTLPSTTSSFTFLTSSPGELAAAGVTASPYSAHISPDFAITSDPGAYATHLTGGGTTNATVEFLTEKVLSLMPLLQQDLTTLDISSSQEETTVDFEAAISTIASVPFTTTSRPRTRWPKFDEEQFDPVDEIMNFVLPNDSSILEDFIKKLIKKDNEPHFLGWCSYHAAEKLWFELLVIGLTVLILSALIPIYCRILRQVMLTRRGHSARKLIMTTLLLLGAFLLCRVPFVIFEVLMVVLMRTKYLRYNGSHLRMMEVNGVFNTLLMVFPLFDPIIYTIRMRAVRRYLAWRLSKCCPSMFSCCWGQELPHSTLAKRFSTFTYALNRGSISGVSGATGRRFSGGSRGGPILSTSVPNHLNEYEAVPTDIDRAPSSGKKFIPRPFSLFFGDKKKSKALKLASSVTFGYQQQHRPVWMTHQSSVKSRYSNNSDGGASINCNSSSTTAKRVTVLSRHYSDSDSITLMNQLRDERLSIGGLSTIEEPIEEIRRSSQIDAKFGVTAKQGLASLTFVDEHDDGDSGSDDAHRASSDKILNKFNNYMVKAAAAVEQQHQPRERLATSSRSDDVFVDSSASASQFSGEHQQLSSPESVFSNRRQAMTLYSRLRDRVRGLGRQPTGTAPGESAPLMVTPNNYFGFFNFNGNVDSTFDPAPVELIDCACECADGMSVDVSCAEVEHETPLLIVPPSATPFPHHHHFVKKTASAVSTPPPPHQPFVHKNLSHPLNSHGSSRPAAPRPALLSNTFILNKIALHTKRLFELEAKTVHATLPSTFSSPVVSAGHC